MYDVVTMDEVVLRIPPEYLQSFIDRCNLNNLNVNVFLCV